MIDKLFDSAVEVILKHEGGYNDIPEDRGGATNYGISLKFLQYIRKDSIVTNKDIKNLTKDEAIELYRKHFWMEYVLKVGLVDSPVLMTYILDMYVNHSPKAVNTIIQKSLVILGQDVTVDGKIGKETRSAVAKVEADYMAYGLHLACKAFRYAYFESLVVANPSQGKFLNGWLNRAKGA